MKKNLYYSSVFRRRNIILETVFQFFFAVCSIPRLLLEVFIRKNFGERYFSMTLAMIIAIVMAFLPIASNLGIHIFYRSRFEPSFDFMSFLLRYSTWYLFLLGFVAACIVRQSEIRRLPSVFDFGRYSLSTGHINQNFLNYRPYGKQLSVRIIETVIEPGFFLLIGSFLWYLVQPIGIVIVLCSICYSISYFAAYDRGDNFIMDQIDEMICNQELTKSFIEGLGPNETRGVNYYGRKPSDAEGRRRLAESFIKDTDTVEAI